MRRLKTYVVAHPKSKWGEIERNTAAWDRGYDLCAVGPTNLLVFRRRNIFVRLWRKIFRG